MAETQEDDVFSYYSSQQFLKEKGITPTATTEEEEEKPTVDVEDEEDVFSYYKAVEKPQPSEAAVTAIDEQESKTLDQFSKDENFLTNLEAYATSRYGDEGKRYPKETDKEYIQRFITHTRGFETNSISLMSQIDWLRSASEEEKAQFGYLYTEIQKLPSFWEAGGDDVARSVRDYIFYGLADPLNLVGFGAGKVAAVGAQQAIKQTLLKSGVEAAKKEAAKLGLKAAAKPLAAATVLEAGGGAGFSYGLQTVEKEAGMREDISDVEAAITGGLTAAIGTGLGVAGARGTGKQIAREMGEAFATKKAASQEAVDKTVQEEIREGYEFDPVNGYEVKTKLSDIKGELTEGELKVELQKRIAKVATEVVEQQAKDGTLSDIVLDPSKRAGDVVRDVIAQIDNVDEDILDGALSRAGITVEDFLDVAGVSLSDGAKTMNAYSDMGKLIKKIRSIDPKIGKRLEELYGKQNSTVGMFGRAHQFMQRLDRERRALMVTQLSTTMRNIATGGMRLTMEGGANLVESSIYHLGKSVNAVMEGRASVAGVKQGMKDIVRDTFGTLLYLNQYGTTKQISEALLVHNPRIARMLDRSLQEVGVDQDLSRFARLANHLNIVQDQFFRRAVFVDSVDKQLRRVGMRLDEFLASGKTLPTDVLKRASEEALSFTFARMPKATRGKVGDTIAHHFIKMNEAAGPLPGLVGAPIGTGAFPFARFMANAMQFQFEYSPLNFVSAVNSGPAMLRYARGLAKEGDAATLRKAREDFSKATVGTAALMAAVKYRAENQDVKWYEAKTEDGRTVDTRPFFPIAPYLMVADLIVKWDSNTLDEASAKDVLEGLTGAQFRAGLSSYMVDSLFDTINAEGGLTGVKAEKMAEYMGGYVGELAGGYVTPGRIVSDVLAAFDEEAAYVRDPRQTEGVGAVERGLGAAGNAFIRNLPVLSESLPVAESPTREAPMIRQSPLLKQITGIQITERRSNVEKELTNLGYENFEIAPSTGDKAADAYVKKHMGELVEDVLSLQIDSEYYRSLSRTEKKAAMKNKLKVLRGIAKSLGKVEAFDDKDDKGYTPFDRAEWSRITTLQRKLADEYYLEKYGKNVAEMQAQEPNKNHFKMGTLTGRALAKAYE